MLKNIVQLSNILQFRC